MNSLHLQKLISNPRCVVIAVLLVCLLPSGCSKPFKGFLSNSDPSTAAESSMWLTSFDEAIQASASTGKPILADFTGTDWCVWCKRLKQDVFNKEEFVAWANENVILLELDFPRHGRQPQELQDQNRQLAEQYQIESYPTVLFLSPNGDVIGQTGYVKGGPTAWIQEANTILNPSGPVR